MPVKIVRPPGSVSTMQSIVEHALVGIANDFIEWQKVHKRVASGDSQKWEVIMRRTGAGQKSNTPNIDGRLLGVPYINYALFGRGQGRRPPWQDILRWMQIRGIRGRDLRGKYRNDVVAAKAIAVQIGKVGTRSLALSGPLQDSIYERNIREALALFIPELAEDTVDDMVEYFVASNKDLRNIKISVS